MTGCLPAARHSARRVERFTMTGFRRNWGVTASSACAGQPMTLSD